MVPAASGVAALASITAAEQGVITDAAHEGPFGFCLTATRPGEHVCLDTFYVGRLNGVGAIWQFTAVDVATRWAVVRLISADKTAQAAARFLRQLRAALAAVRVELTGIRTDRGPEFIGTDFTTAVRELGVRHVLCPPRSPNHNAVVERFQGTVLHEFYRPFFHRFVAAPPHHPALTRAPHRSDHLNTQRYLASCRRRGVGTCVQRAVSDGSPSSSSS